ncbi:E3 binding domain-containing protein, partial [Aureimonas sp. Leaf460]|uniref:E3 binding domain-containing protein n=1 Tax=Aureimonas sp. Leaf460 TaxID=1736384 RepID=UPI001910DCC8
GAEGIDISVGSPVAWIYAEGEAAAPSSGQPTPQPLVGPDPDVELDARRAEAGEVAALTGGTKEAAPAEPGALAETRRGVRATPLARRLARERGIDLAALTGRGPQGRIQREDVEAVAEAAPASARAPDAPTPAPVAARPASASAPTPRRSPESGAAPLHLVSLREGQGTPIVLIHGFGSESASWRPLLAELAKVERPILGVDLARHGASLEARADGFDALVAGVEETLGAEGIG